MLGRAAVPFVACLVHNRKNRNPVSACDVDAQQAHVNASASASAQARYVANSGPPPAYDCAHLVSPLEIVARASAAEREHVAESHVRTSDQAPV